MCTPQLEIIACCNKEEQTVQKQGTVKQDNDI